MLVWQLLENGAMRAQEWPHIVRALRNLHGLTPEQFAIMMATTEEAVLRWEAGLSVPEPREQAVLRDALCGHYKHHPTFRGLQAMVRNMGEKCTLYTPGMIVQTISPSLEQWLKTHRVDLVGSSVLPRMDGLTLEMMERYALPMLDGKSDALSLTYIDRAIANRRAVLHRRMSAVPLDGVRVLVLIDQVLYEDDGTSVPNLDLNVVTADDIQS